MIWLEPSLETSIDSVCVAICAGLELPVAWTVKLAVPGVVGVPLITPVEESRPRPAGRFPLLTDHA
jgi:hypothetical protein